MKVFFQVIFKRDRRNKNLNISIITFFDQQTQLAWRRKNYINSPIPLSTHSWTHLLKCAASRRRTVCPMCLRQKIGSIEHFGFCFFLPARALLSTVIKFLFLWFNLKKALLSKHCFHKRKDTIISVMDYLAYPVSVTVETAYESPTNFPAVTICNK